MSVQVLQGDCVAILPTLPPDTFDSCVTDPPYHLTSIVKRFGATAVGDDTQTSDRSRRRADGYARLATGFMGKKWDGSDVAFRPETWAEVLRVLKPGSHLFAFGGTRTYHRLACAIEDAGFEIRDQFAWTYASGFPKSHDVSKAIDKAAGVDVPTKAAGGGTVNAYGDGLNVPWGSRTSHLPFSDSARAWAGWGTAVKPAWEPLCLARKPLSAPTVAANVLRWGTGALNIDACRIATDDALGGGGEHAETAGKFTNEGWRRPWMDDPEASEAFAAKVRANVQKAQALGRWPANLAHDGSEEVLAAFPQQSSVTGKRTERSKSAVVQGTQWLADNHQSAEHTDSGSPARFFFCPKADAADRAGSKHPTVKPVDLIRHYLRLITPPGGLVLDCFAGSGTTGEAAMLEGFNATLIDSDPQSVADMRHRLARWSGQDAPLFSGNSTSEVA